MLQRSVSAIRTKDMEKCTGNHKHELHDRFFLQNATTTDYMPQTNRCVTLCCNFWSLGFGIECVSSHLNVCERCLECVCIRLVCKCSVVRNQSQHNGSYRGLLEICLYRKYRAYVFEVLFSGMHAFLGKFKCLHVKTCSVIRRN